MAQLFQGHLLPASNYIHSSGGIGLQLCFPAKLGAGNWITRRGGCDPLALLAARARLCLTGSPGAGHVLSVVVGFCFFLLLLQAGLQAVPSELYDAAVVDGAGPLQTWWLITIPSLRPTFIFLFITGTIDAMSRFSDLWMLGGPAGTPARSLQTIVMYMYQTAFESNDFNLASASGVILFVVVLILTLVNFRSFLGREFSSQSGV